MAKNNYYPEDMCEKLAYLYVLKKDYSEADPEEILHDYINTYDTIHEKWDSIKEGCDHPGWTSE